MLYTCVLDYSTAVVGTSGYNFWLNNLRSHALSIQGAYTDFLGYQPKTMSNSTFMEKLYECALFRTIDSANEQNAIAQLTSGKLTRPQLVQAILSSAEFKVRILPLLSALK